MLIGVRIEESWSWYKTVSMVGGTIRRKLIHRESFKASVLRLTLATTRCKKHCTPISCLDNTFVLARTTRPLNIDIRDVLLHHERHRGCVCRRSRGARYRD